MNLRLGPHLPGQGEHARVGNDQRVTPLRLHIPQAGKISRGLLQILIVGKNIGRDIYLHASGMGKNDALGHLFRGKILRLGPQPERFAAYVHRVRPEDHRRLQHLQAARRDQ